MTKGSRGLVVVGPALAVTTLLSCYARAAEEAAHGGHHVPTVADLLFPAINFAIFAYIVGRFLVPAIREYLRRRRDEIVADVQAARSALNNAEHALASVRERLNVLEAEAEGIRNDLVAVATRQTERLHVSAEESGKRRLEDARLLAEHERRRDLQAIRGETAALATSIAERRIRAMLSPDDHRAFVRQLLEDVTVR